MEAYFQFLVLLACGLAGLCLVLKVLLDKLFDDWDVFAELAAFWKACYADKNFLRLERTEDRMMDVERSQAPDMNTRLIEANRELKDAEVLDREPAFSAR